MEESMQKNKPIQLLAQITLLVVLSAGLVNCGNPHTVTPPSTIAGLTEVTPTGVLPTDTPMGNGTSSITIVIPEEPPSFNALISDTGYDALVMHMTLLGMTGIDPDGKIFPVLASELPSVDNGGVIVNNQTQAMDVTWKMRQDVTWADGTPVTADDVLFTYDAARDPTNGFALPGLDQVTGIDKLDDHSFVVHFSTTYPGYLTFLGGRQIVIWPKHYCKIDQGFTAWDCGRNPLSDGPYLLKEWVSGDHMIFVRNPIYFEPGKPNIDQIIVRIVPDASVRVTMMRKGDADLLMWATEQVANDLKSASNVNLSVSPTSRWVMRLFINLAAKGTTDPVASPNPFFGDVRVRQAIRMAIDVDKITNSVWYGYAQPVWTEFFRPPFNICNIPRPKFNVEAAKALLDQAGWVAGSDGIRVCKGCKYAHDGDRFQFDLLTYSEYGEPLILTQQLIGEMLDAIGIQANLTQAEGSVMWADSASGGIEQSGNYNMDLYDDGYAGIDPSYFLSYYYSSASAVPDQGWNVVRFMNTAFDEALTQTNSLDAQTSQAAFCQMAQILDQQLPQILLFTTLNAEAYSSRLSNIQANINSVVSWNAADWTIVK
jgi:peptide/nickel transport system substrate-binding protein